MPDLRAFCAPPWPGLAPGAVVPLNPEESHHLVAVHRARPGDPVVVFDGQGQEAEGVIEAAIRRGATVRLVRISAPRTRPSRLVLAQALPKGPAMDLIVRKATELGAAAIHPLSTERTVVRLDEERSGRKEEKWRAAAIEAAKQCGNPWLPEIAPLTSFDSFLAGPNPGLRLIASLQPGARTIREALAKQPVPFPAEAVVLIGPEGDFSPAEYARAQTSGFKPITLGPLVLRSDTAATVALALIAAELQLAGPAQGL